MKLVKKQLPHRTLTYLKNKPIPGAPVLLFLHGFPDSPKVFRYQYVALKNQYNLLAPYAPGVDGESVPKTPLLDELAQDYLGLLDVENAAEVIIIAHDLGGPIAGRMAKLAPERISKIIFINAPTIEQLYFRKNSLTQLIKSYYLLFFQAPGLTKRLIKFNWKRFQKALFVLNKIDRPEHYEGAVVLESMHLYKSFARELPRLILGSAPRLTVPCEFIWAKRDFYLNIPGPHELQTLFQDYTLEIMPGHHWLPLEKPQEINAAISQRVEAVLAKFHRAGS